MSELKPGDSVRMTPECVAALRIDGSDLHADEFGDAVGVVDGAATDGEFGQEVTVLWPNGARHLYAVEYLELVGATDGDD